MGQTSTEAKREVEQTRAHLGETLEALQLRAKRNLDLKTQLQTNHVLQLVVGTLVLAVTGFAVFGYRTRRRRSTAEQLARKLKLNDLRDRLEEFRDDAKAWASAQKRIVKANGKTKVEVQSKESIGRRLLIGAAEAAITALAAGYARRLVSGSSTPRPATRAGSSAARAPRTSAGTRPSRRSDRQGRTDSTPGRARGGPAPSGAATAATDARVGSQISALASELDRLARDPA